VRGRADLAAKPKLRPSGLEQRPFPASAQDLNAKQNHSGGDLTLALRFPYLLHRFPPDPKPFLLPNPVYIRSA